MLSAPSPFTFILFGASGHLAKLKLYPAFYVLALKKRLPQQYKIVGFSRTKLSDKDFQKIVEESVRAHLPEVNEKVLKEFLSHCSYFGGEYKNDKDFSALNTQITKWESSWEKPVRLAYFSVPPSVFPDISKNLCKGGIHDKSIPFRCIVEKPVGHNLASFQEVKDQLIGCFKEEEIYLLDHYLGKEAVRNVYYLRHSNPVVERLLKNSLIHHVEITASEIDGLEGRAGYFENSGLFRDMFQSHLLMVASLLTARMAETEDSFKKRLSDALIQFYLPPANNLDEVVLQAQYQAGEINSKKVPGYLKEEGVKKGSRTNTYIALKLLNRTSRWQGVPFYLRSGKRLQKKETRISIQFQAPYIVAEGTEPNRLDIILQGEAGMRLHLQTKMGGTDPRFRPLILEDPLVCVGDCLPEHALLVLEAIKGKKQWFLTFDNIHTAWRLIDPLQSHLDDSKTPLYSYPAGSAGPAEANNWIKGDGVEWM
jgi:glucose-6-phosphate 1-dehydrogenase